MSLCNSDMKGWKYLIFLWMHAVSLEQNKYGADVKACIRPVELKGCICHFIKWRIHPFHSRTTIYMSQKKNNVQDEMTGTLQASYMLSHILWPSRETFYSSALYKYFCNQHWQQSRAICLSFLPVPSRIISRCNCSAHYYAEVNSSRPNGILLLTVQDCPKWNISQQTWEVGPTFVYRWANVVDGGPTVNHCWANVSCLLGLLLADYSKWFSWHFASTIFSSHLTTTLQFQKRQEA